MLQHVVKATASAASWLSQWSTSPLQSPDYILYTLPTSSTSWQC